MTRQQSPLEPNLAKANHNMPLPSLDKALLFLAVSADANRTKNLPVQTRPSALAQSRAAKKASNTGLLRRKARRIMVHSRHRQSHCLGTRWAKLRASAEPSLAA